MLAHVATGEQLAWSFVMRQESATQREGDRGKQQIQHGLV